MNVIALVLFLFISCGSLPVTQKLDQPDPQGTKTFCEIMNNPKLMLGKPITLEATAWILYGGILLTPDECKVPDVSVHYMKDYEQGSNTEALELVERFERQAHEAHLRGAEIKAERTIVKVVFEGKLAKNPFYHATWDRGSATVAAWDFNEEYNFVVTRVVSVRQLQ